MSLREEILGSTAPLLDAWSWSRYETYMQCPLKFKLQVLGKFKKPQTPAMARGNTAHLDLAAYVTGKTAVMPAVVVHPFQRQLVDLIRNFEDKEVEQQWGFDRRWRQTGWFEKRAGVAAWFRAILDVAILYNDDMIVEPIDWKTGKVYGSNDEQMELFALSAMLKYKPAVHVTTRLVYLDAQIEQVAEYPAADRDKLVAKWEQKIAPMFNDRDFIARPNDKCRFCDFARSNWSGEGPAPCRFG